MQFACFTILATYLPTPGLHAQPNSVVPHSVPLPPPIEAPSDIAYRGVIHLNVDATDVLRRIYQIQEIIPVETPGKQTLLFPEWTPGDHAPNEPLEKLAGLV